MSGYPSIAKEFSNDVNGRQKKENIWSEMTTKLKAMGPKKVCEQLDESKQSLLATFF